MAIQQKEDIRSSIIDSAFALPSSVGNKIRGRKKKADKDNIWPTKASETREAYMAHLKLGLHKGTVGKSTSHEVGGKGRVNRQEQASSLRNPFTNSPYGYYMHLTYFIYSFSIIFMQEIIAVAKT